MTFAFAALAALALASPPQEPAGEATAREPRSFRAWLDVPGGELAFGLELVPVGSTDWNAFLVNDPERIPVPEVRWDGTELLLGMTHYDSRIRATLVDGRLQGEWEKVRGVDNVARVPFQAVPAPGEPQQASAGLPRSVDGRWAVDFESDDLVSVGIFEQEPGSRTVRGTFLTHTGDYRFLAGTLERGALTLSCFDGAHAFLFKARVTDKGLDGHFWSGNWWHETWSATRDENVRLGSAFEQTSWNEGTGLADLVFPGTDGQPVALADARFAGRPMILQVFGTWCPNCNDETRYLVELHERYADRGLAIVGLAFELTDDFQRNAAQVETYRERYGVPYPMLVAGPAGKPKSTAALGALDFIRSYPTTIFLSRAGEVQAVHSGFTGPATGEAHAELRREFEGRIEELLGEPAPSPTGNEEFLLAHSPWASDRWVGRRAWRIGYRFTRDDDGSFACWSMPVEDGKASFAGTYLAAAVTGQAVRLDESWFSYRLDPRAQVLLHPLDVGARIYPQDLGPAPLFHGRPEEDVLAALASKEPLLRREALVALTVLRRAAGSPAPEALPLLEDPGLQVRRTAAWSLGATGTSAGRAGLVEALTHPNAGLRREAVDALALLLGRGEALDTHLGPLAQDADPFVRDRVDELLSTGDR